MNSISMRAVALATFSLCSAHALAEIKTDGLLGLVHTTERTPP